MGETEVFYAQLERDGVVFGVPISVAPGEDADERITQGLAYYKQGGFKAPAAAPSNAAVASFHDRISGSTPPPSPARTGANFVCPEHGGAQVAMGNRGYLECKFYSESPFPGARDWVSKSGFHRYYCTRHAE